MSDVVEPSRRAIPALAGTARIHNNIFWLTMTEAKIGFG